MIHTEGHKKPLTETHTSSPSTGSQPASCAQMSLKCDRARVWKCLRSCSDEWYGLWTSIHASWGFQVSDRNSHLVSLHWVTVTRELCTDESKV